MLSDTARPVIEATLPLVGSRIGEITPLFYQKMFAAHPELLNGTFSRANQANGTQRQALAGAIAAFASHLLTNPDTLPEAVLSRIAHKHTSLGITEDQYQIVYKYLFEAIDEGLGESPPPEDAAAWTSGPLVFKDASLIRVIGEIRRWYGVTLRVTDSSLVDRTLTFDATGESVDQVLKIIGLDLGARIERQGDTATVTPIRSPNTTR